MKIKCINEQSLFNEIVKYLCTHYDNFCYEQHVNAIDKCICRAQKYVFKSVDAVCITQSEMDIIQEFHDVRKEKIVFVSISIAKYLNAIYHQEQDVLFLKPSEIFKYARVSISATERDRYFSFMYENNILSKDIAVGHFVQKVNVISHDDTDPIVMSLSENDYKELAYTYLNFKNGGYKRCARCGRWFKMKKNEPARLYCHLHQQKDSMACGMKQRKCIDCGDLFYVSAKNNKTDRCSSCQAERTKQLKLAWWHNHNNVLDVSN